MTFIICEVGSNWTSFEEAKDSITMAKCCGADAVKFQLFSFKDLYGHGNDDTALPKEWVPKLAEKAKACGIEFMCTAFSPEGLDFLNSYVGRHKIASSDLSYAELLEKASSYASPVLLSTGGSSISDIGIALNTLNKANTILLYCMSAYPSKSVNLFHIDKLHETFQVPVGYSCHTQDWYTPVSAVKHHGASVIEKHFKLKEMNTPDAPHSLLPDDFKKMVDAIRGEVRTSFPDPQELEFQLKHKRRLIAIKDIKAGELLVYKENYGCYRSLKEDSHGLSGFAYRHVDGKLALKDHKAGEPIVPDSFGQA